MPKLKVQIVAFDNPYPPTFGGAIDVYYKIEALAERSVEVYLHFFYSDRFDIGPLNTLCKKVYTYKRNTSLYNHMSLLPFRVKSRMHKDLQINLNNINVPVIFEGLHSTSALISSVLKPDFYIRAHNIEHDYTRGLANNETNILLKLAHHFEAYKLKKYQKRILKKPKRIFALSKNDCNYFRLLQYTDVDYIPVFHGNKACSNDIKQSEDKYALYHGDLTSVSNLQSVFFLIDVFKNLDYKLIIAGSKNPNKLKSKLMKVKNCSFQYVKSNDDLTNLISEAHVNVLYSNQQSGTKLKVFNALYNGKFVIVNKNIVDDQEILNICMVANTKSEYIEAVKIAFNKEFQLKQNRIETLALFSDSITSNKLIQLLN